MGMGIKQSKTAMFDIKYEMFENSGPSSLPLDHIEDYIVGEDTELPSPIHDPIYIPECSSSVDVYLEPIDNKDNNGNTEYDTETRKFENPITSVDDQVGELNLYAKGYQQIYGSTKVWFPSSSGGEGDGDLTSKITIFKGDQSVGNQVETIKNGSAMSEGYYDFDDLLAEGVYVESNEEVAGSLYQCTAWVAARLQKLNSAHPKVGDGASGFAIAKSYYNGDTSTDYYAPKAGALACFDAHVAFVESVTSDGLPVFSHGNGNGSAKYSVPTVRVVANDYGSVTFLGYVYTDVCQDTPGPTPPSPTVPQTQYGTGGQIFLNKVDILFHGPTTQGDYYSPKLELYIDGQLVASNPGGKSSEVGGVYGTGNRLTNNIFITAQGPYHFTELYGNTACMTGITYYEYTTTGPGTLHYRGFDGQAGTDGVQRNDNLIPQNTAKFKEEDKKIEEEEDKDNEKHIVSKNVE